MIWLKGSIKNARHDSEYATGSEYGRVWNVPYSKMPGSHRVLNMAESFVIMPDYD